jgi:hypothetical protein
MVAQAHVADGGADYLVGIFFTVSYSEQVIVVLVVVACTDITIVVFEFK